MCSVLSSDTLRLFAASIESLFLSIVGLGIPRQSNRPDISAKFAPEVGLLGVASELAMAACLVESYGIGILSLPNSHYKSGAQILDAFRDLLRKDIEKAQIITSGIKNQQEHIETLLKQTARFRFLINARSGGLHAGKGQNYNVAVAVAQDVADFLRQLEQSDVIGAVFTDIPAPPNLVRERTILVEDLVNQIRKAQDASEKAALIQSAFLVLPDMPEEKPDWLNAFDRIKVTPEKDDITFLLDVIERAHPVRLMRQASIGSPLPVRVAAKEAPAVPVSPLDIRREFTQMRDQWQADVGNANARIKDGILHLPPNEFILKVFVEGIDSIKVAEENGSITASQTWPYIVSSLNMMKVVRPFWFLVRRTDDLGTLIALLEQANAIAKPYLQRNISNAIVGIICIQQGSKIPAENPLHEDAQKSYATAILKRSTIAHAIQRHRGTKREATVELEARLGNIISEAENVGTILIDIVKRNIDLAPECRRYWAGLLCEVALKKEETKGLLEILKSRDLLNAYSLARRSFQLIDFIHYGPSSHFDS